MKNLFTVRWLIIRTFFILHFSFFICLSSSAQISKLADSILINDSVISSGHIGISIYEPATNSYLYNYNAAKYFVPASNTKLFTLYAGMKYLGDSLVGLRYLKSKPQSDHSKNFYSVVYPSGDPTFLYPDFPNQPILKFFESDSSATFIFIRNKIPVTRWGKGWAWDDFAEGFMPERSSMPVYGNVYSFYKSGDTVLSWPRNLIVMDGAGDDPHPFYFNYPKFKILRSQYSNEMWVTTDRSFPDFTKATVPFITGELQTRNLIKDTVKNFHSFYSDGVNFNILTNINIIHSQPTDSLFKPMMHRSDNFFAEQTLLMVSNEHLGYMNDEDIIDTLLKKDLKDVPQKPEWVDGCGLSRYNLFTSQSFVYILNKMKNEFGLKRLEVILPTGGEGTLKNYYLKDSGYIYAKTGSMNNIFCLSGYLITSKNKLLIFSILANNFMGNTTPVRHAIEQFLEAVRTNY